jgi:hypothetical protein
LTYTFYYQLQGDGDATPFVLSSNAAADILVTQVVLPAYVRPQLLVQVCTAKGVCVEQQFQNNVTVVLQNFTSTFLV